jgi:hypothetical protein
MARPAALSLVQAGWIIPTRTRRLGVSAWPGSFPLIPRSVPVSGRKRFQLADRGLDVGEQAGER